jgi:TonB family protein
MVNVRMVRIVFITLAVVLAGRAAASSQPSPAQILSWQIAKPYPEYPASARARQATGSGVFKLHFKTKTGTVRSVEIVQSTGDKALDASCVKAFSRWRFKPGVLPSIKSGNPKTKEPFADEDFVAKIPITFTMNGQVDQGGARNVPSGDYGSPRGQPAFVPRGVMP